jgi:hypothetical protein
MLGNDSQNLSRNLGRVLKGDLMVAELPIKGQAHVEQIGKAILLRERPSFGG